MEDGLLISLLREAEHVVGAAQSLLRAARLEYDAEAEEQGEQMLGPRLAHLTGERCGPAVNDDPLGRVADKADQTSHEIGKLVSAIERAHGPAGEHWPGGTAEPGDAVQ